MKYKHFLFEASSVLRSLVRSTDDPFDFLEKAMNAQKSGKLKLRVRGAANARELLAYWYAVKNREGK